MAECRAKLETGAGTFNRMRADIAAVRQYIEQEARAMHEEHLHEISDVRSRLEKEAGEVRARVEEAAKAAVPKNTPWVAIIGVFSVLMLAGVGAVWNLGQGMKERPTSAEVDAKLIVVQAIQTAQSGQASDIKAIRESLTAIQTDVGTLKTDVGTLKTDVAVLKATGAPPAPLRRTP